MDGITEGVKNMVGPIIILTLAWTISGICGEGYLDTGAFIGHVVETSNIAIQLLPAIILAIAALLAFATGTSWGTFGILIPIVMGICNALGNVSPTLQVILISATLAGAVYGDHVSPISDSTILSSAGAQCNHLNHVSTQLPYATLVIVCCFISYLVAGFVQNAIISLIVAFALLAAALAVVNFLDKKKAAKA